VATANTHFMLDSSQILLKLMTCVLIDVPIL
jgi:hypothetical protein